MRSIAWEMVVRFKLHLEKEILLRREILVELISVFDSKGKGKRNR